MDALNIFLIELVTVVNLSILYLAYVMINRHVRDKSAFIVKTSEKIVPRTEIRPPSGILTMAEDVPVLKKPVEEVNPEPLLKTMKVESSFDGKRIGEYKK